MAGALVPVAVAAASAARLSEWLYAVVGYRFDGGSLVTGSFSGGPTSSGSLPPAGKALGPLALLAAVGWRRSPLLARIWLGAAVVGVLGGGNFHPHYYLQLVAAAFVAGGGWRPHAVAWRRAPRSPVGAAAAATFALALPVAWATPTEQAKTIWPADPHLVHDAALARYVRAHTLPTERVLAVWATPTSTTSLTAGPPSATSGRATLPRFRAPSRPSATHWRRGGRSSWSSSNRPRSSIRAAARPLCCRREYRHVARVGGASVYRSRSHRMASATNSFVAPRA